MEAESARVFSAVLTADELKSIPNDITKKLAEQFQKCFNEEMISRANLNSAKRELDEIKDATQKQIQDLTIKTQEYEVQLDSAQQSAVQLSTQLDNAREELMRMQEAGKRYDAETADLRRQRDQTIDERDSMAKMLERRTNEIERLQSEYKLLESQLHAAVKAKCEAIEKLDEFDGKESSLAFKEKRLEQERKLFNSRIEALEIDLHRYMSENQSLRRENTVRVMTLETKLNEKSEELKIANSTIAHYTETNAALTAKTEDLASKLNTHNHDVTKMMENYRKQLQSQTNLVNLYKEGETDKTEQIKELTDAVTEMKGLLNEATEKYGDLETTMKDTELRHLDELREKEDEIKKLNDELVHANELLKVAERENIDHVLEKMAPTAAMTSQITKANMTLTQIYSLYVKECEAHSLLKKEHSRIQLNSRQIMQELEERAPIINRERIEYQQAIETNQQLHEQLEAKLQECIELKDQLRQAIDKNESDKRELVRSKRQQADLARQVCILLEEVRVARGGQPTEYNDSMSNNYHLQDMITKDLVTFRNIEEMQDNNSRLLLVVRDLTQQIEQMETLEASLSKSSFEEKIKSYEIRLDEYKQKAEEQNNMIESIVKQRDRYKVMYDNAVKKYGVHAILDSSESLSDHMMDGIEHDAIVNTTGPSSIASNEAILSKDRRISDLEEKIKELMAKLKEMKDEYDEYKKEKHINEKMLNEQFDSMRTELRELTTKNCKFATDLEYANQQIHLQHKNAATYKKQIATLEERNKNYEKTIVKHEQTVTFLRDETMAVQNKLSRSDSHLENLKAQCRMLKESESRLQMERDTLMRERQSQNLVLANLEMIKVGMERSESEGKMRVEARLDEALRECAVLRRRIQEEQDHFREAGKDLERQTQNAKRMMEEEKQAADRLRADLTEHREELTIKSQQIEELSNKLKESLTPNRNDNPLSQANKTIKELRCSLNERTMRIDQLTADLQQAKTHIEQYSKMSESAEHELKNLHTAYSEYKEKTNAEISQLRQTDAQLKEKVAELETEISLKITQAQVSCGDTSSQLKKAQMELHDALQKLSTNNREIRELRDQNNSLNTSLQSVEQKYNNEMLAHSDDIRAMTTMKEELISLQDQIRSMTMAKENALAELEKYRSRFDQEQSVLGVEKEEFERRIRDLDQLNANLQDQVMLLTTNLSLNTSTNDDSMRDDSSHGNRSFTEDDAKKCSNLNEIIKYLRKEKNIAVAKYDVLQSENIRIKAEHSIIEKKFMETSAQLEKERSKSEMEISSATMHEKILRSVSTIDALTDSNRALREERNSLQTRLDELMDQIKTIEDEIFPLQEKNRELTAKYEETHKENLALRNDATRWRTRSNSLVEKNTRNPEDFKRLQNERENLAKMLTTEKENITKCNEELKSMRMEKLKSDAEILKLSKQVLQLSQDKGSLDTELSALKQGSQKQTTEITELKNAILLKEADIKKLADEIAAKESAFIEIKAKEMQIKKIAKKYKDMYGVVKKIGGENAADLDKFTSDLQKMESGEPSTSVRVDFEKTINDLNLNIATLQQENSNLQDENKTLRAQLEKEERQQQMLKEAKGRIITCNRDNNMLKNEIEQTKAEALLIKSQFEAHMSRCDKEKADLEKERQEAIARVANENESLKMRLNSLLQKRQLGAQQGAKPSTSSGVSGEKSSNESTPRTANVKPMAGPSGQQSATVTPWRGGDTPLASIRPMPVQNNRTAAVLPTNVATVQGSAATALVPPQQQVHTTGGSGGSSNAGEAMSSSPTSSHTDYMPATSSATVAIVSAVPPMGAAASSAESSQEAESDNLGESSAANGSTSSMSGAQQQQQAVALVSPRVETAQNLAPPCPPTQQADQNQAPSTSGTSSSSSSSSSSTSSTATPLPSTSNSGGSATVAMSTHHQASSSNTVTTTQAGHKRPRGDMDGDSSMEAGESVEKLKPSQNKRTRVQIATSGETFQGVSESGLDVEYQVPTSSQRDQEYDIVVVDSEDDDDEASSGMPDEGTAEADDGPFDDNNDAYEGMEVEEEMANFQEIDGPNIDDDQVPSYNSEVDVGGSREVNNDAGSSGVPGTSHSAEVNVDLQSRVVQQIQTISSGSDWRQLTMPRQQQQSSQQHLHMVYEDAGDDSIVPSTPTLCVPRRADGFSEVVSSPNPIVPGRFTFTTDEAAASGSGTLQNIDDTRLDLSGEIDGTKSVPTTPQQLSPQREAAVEGSSISAQQQLIDVVAVQASGSSQEPTAGPSHSTKSTLPEITVTGVSGVDLTIESM